MFNLTTDRKTENYNLAVKIEARPVDADVFISKHLVDNKIMLVPEQRVVGYGMDAELVTTVIVIRKGDFVASLLNGKSRNANFAECGICVMEDGKAVYLLQNGEVYEVPEDCDIGIFFITKEKKYENSFAGTVIRSASQETYMAKVTSDAFVREMMLKYFWLHFQDYLDGVSSIEGVK